ncbi:MAG TPA: CheR family methyltransferase [Bacteriovoracaceae bacterium]|nr:CheR family methyltransferase [Bacteriovoracaceae bacterium]
MAVKKTKKSNILKEAKGSQKTVRKNVTKKNNTDFFIVGIGASAGGLEAFKEFLTYLPIDTGMSFVFIQHLSPTHKSFLPEILTRMSPLSVHEAKHGVQVKPDNIYVIPSNLTLSLNEGTLELEKRNPKDKPHLPIDRFFESLANDQKNRAIAVVLSGTGSDGADGSRIVKAQGGITFAQSPNTAKFESMPAKAIVVDDIDFILAPKDMARELASIGQMNIVHKNEDGVNENITMQDDKEFAQIITLLRQTSGTDFSQYKPTTIRRRISRRMLLHKLEHLKDYYKFLQDNPNERLQLGEDVLINVTHFFREPESYEYLKQQLLPTILKNKAQDAPLRIWVAGCSTGEEAYSIAICVMEIMGAETHPLSVQIFATDLSDKCIERARNGKYFESISEYVSQERLAKYFTRLDNGYRISKAIRDICVFAKHDLSRDPAYSKLDVISCKNLLIYLDQDLQVKVLESFHYSLNSNGYLMLGSSESVGKASELYSMVDPKQKVYSKKSISSRLQPFISRRDFNPPELTSLKSKREPTPPTSYEIQIEADRAILSRYSPPSVVINGKFEILQFRGSTEQFLIHKHGEASLNLVRMARDGLGAELKKAIIKAKDKDTSIREESLKLTGVGLISFEVIPLKFLPGERYFLIVFETQKPYLPREDMPTGKGQKKSISQSDYESVAVAQLKQELSFVKDNLQIMIQDFESANQELQSANEEIVSSNEELQSTNEELETSKEELQSTNEELNTVNDELQERNEELFGLNNDLLNVLNSVQIPIIIVGNDLSIRRYIGSASKLFNFIHTDIGRPFSHITSNCLDTVELTSMIKIVLENAIVQEKDILTSDRTWLHVRIRPYKTEENKIEGAVVTLQEVDDLKNFVELTKVIIDGVEYPIIVLDADQKVVVANKAFESIFKVEVDVMERLHILKVKEGLFEKIQLKKLISEVSSGSKDIVSKKLELGKKKVQVSVRKITTNKSVPTQYLIAFEDKGLI